MGLSRAGRLAQGQSIKIQLCAPFPVQIDGEPWFQQPCTLIISHHGQVLSFSLHLPLHVDGLTRTCMHTSPNKYILHVSVASIILSFCLLYFQYPLSFSMSH